MKAKVVYFKGNMCFTRDWVGFEAIKPINVIIGRNNSGKSKLLDLVRVLCGQSIESADWDIQCKGILDKDSLLPHFPPNASVGALPGILWKHGQRLVGAEIAWETSRRGGEPSVKLFDDSLVEHRYAETSKREIIARLSDLVRSPTHQLTGTIFRKLLADRDIRPETENTELNLAPNGEGASNIIRRFILSSSQSFPREVIQEELLAALNSIFANDGQFSEIQANLHDEPNSNELVGSWEIFFGEKTKGLVSLGKSGSGLKTVLLVLLNLLVVPQIDDRKANEYTFAFEELENNLHPALLRRLLLFIEAFAVSKGCTVFLTTHSSTALDVFGMSKESQIIHVTHDGEAAKALRVKAHFDQLSVVSELGAKPSDLLQANGIVWVEGPSDRIYLNRWIELYSNGELTEGRDYQCAYYGGSILERTEFKSADEPTNLSLANLFRVNPNIVVVCDSDRRAKGAHLKRRVSRIRSEVKAIPNGYIWITVAKEIENYIPGQVLGKLLRKPPLPNPGQYQNFFPRVGSKNRSYVYENLGRKTFHKVELAMRSTEHMTTEAMKGMFDWEKEVRAIVNRIRSWNS